MSAVIDYEEYKKSKTIKKDKNQMVDGTCNEKRTDENSLQSASQNGMPKNDPLDKALECVTLLKNGVDRLKAEETKIEIRRREEKEKLQNQINQLTGRVTELEKAHKEKCMEVEQQKNNPGPPIIDKSMPRGNVVEERRRIIQAQRARMDRINASAPYADINKCVDNAMEQKETNSLVTVENSRKNTYGNQNVTNKVQEDLVKCQLNNTSDSQNKTEDNFIINSLKKIAGALKKKKTWQVIVIVILCHLMPQLMISIGCITVYSWIAGKLLTKNKGKFRLKWWMFLLGIASYVFIGNAALGVLAVGVGCVVFYFVASVIENVIFRKRG